MQYHFVVIYDEETDGWDIEADPETILGSDKIAYDTNACEWYELDELMLSDYEDYESMLAGKLMR